MKVLIIGGAGYIGSLLTEYLLKKNYHVTVIDNLLYGQNSLSQCCVYSKYNFIFGSISDKRLLNKVINQFDIIIPLAAIVGAPACDVDPDKAKKINYDSIIWLIQNLDKEKKIIFPTTNSGYGVGQKNKFCTEKSPLKPISIYGKYKVEIEKRILDRQNSLSFRLATVFGTSPRMRLDLLVNNFVYKAFFDKYLVLFEEHFSRNYIHIRDVCRVFHYALNNFNKMKNKPYNVGLENANLTKLQLAEKIKFYIPKLLIHCSKIGKDPDKRDYIVSNKRILSTGWKPKYDIDFGIKELINFYKSYKNFSNSNY